MRAINAAKVDDISEMSHARKHMSFHALTFHWRD